MARRLSGRSGMGRRGRKGTILHMERVEKWDFIEIEVKCAQGLSFQNPFTQGQVTGTFRGEREEVRVSGFYDGDDCYKVRFMPAHEGRYAYVIEGNILREAITGEFEAVSPKRENNHGRVRVVGGCHLGYEDGTPYYSIGTTCYAWVHQSMELQEQTLETLKGSPFNKIRFCIFPKFYEFNKKEPLTYPFERGTGQGLDGALAEQDRRQRKRFPGMEEPRWDFDFDYFRPNTAHFQRFDLRIRQLRDLGIEADIILMHPYDRWGMNLMQARCCDQYLRYMIARYGAYRNVWWSLANEYDLIGTKTGQDWERYGEIFYREDPYGHLRSIHNCMGFYDYSREWITHCSMQRQDFYKTTEYTDEYLEQYGKPVVWDEICYEGNIHFGWGNITAQELVRRFWEAFLRGGCAGHGETFLDEKEILWWSHGGILKGESPQRLRFLLKICQETPGGYLRKGPGLFDEVVGIGGEGESDGKASGSEPCGYEIHYLGITRPAYRMLYLPQDQEYQVEVIDTWGMTVEDAGVHSGTTRIELPARQYMAIRIRRVRGKCCGAPVRDADKK